MQSTFWTYTKIGFQHIADIHAYDHIVFILALSAIYSFREWKNLLILITAFTLGHSISLALSVLELVNLNSNTIETLIPVTIILTALANIIQSEKTNYPNNKNTKKYAFTTFFGLIHGLGFSNYLKNILSHQSNILTELLSFNIGLEIGQILILLIILSLHWLAIKLGTKKETWIIFISGLCTGIAINILLS